MASSVPAPPIDRVETGKADVPAAASARAPIERLLPRPVADAHRAAWGFTNRTGVVTLASSEREVLQRYRRREDAEYRLRVMRAPRIAAALSRQPEHLSDAPDYFVVRGDVPALHQHFCWMAQAILGVLAGLNRLYHPASQYLGLQPRLPPITWADRAAASQLKP